MPDTQESLSLFPCLICHENTACFNEEQEEKVKEHESDDEDDEFYTNYFNSSSKFDLDEEEDYIEKLVEREIGSGSDLIKTDCPISSQIWVESARLEAIDWILNTQKALRFQPHTAYLSLNYFDRFIAKRPIDEREQWAIQLLSVACLSLAAKMVEERVPPLSEFHVPNHSFEDESIQRMELLILSTLSWKMASITPFSFLNFFVRKFLGGKSISIPKGLFSRASKLIFSITKEIDYIGRYRASVVAAGAVLAASDCGLTRKTMMSKIGSLSSGRLLANEDVFSCYELMKEIEMGKNRTPKKDVPEDLSPRTSNSDEVVESSGGRRRRLTFDGSSSGTVSPAKKLRLG